MLSYKRQRLYALLLFLTIGFLFVPLVFMKIGPGGYEYYGPTCPDIYIYGGDITGKDKGWWAIGFAYQFQRICILFFGLLVFLEWRYYRYNWTNYLHVYRTVLLVLFPYWLNGYQSGVQNNSDGADLTVYPQWGLAVYGAICIVHVVLVVGRSRIWNKLLLKRQSG